MNSGCTLFPAFGYNYMIFFQFCLQGEKCVYFFSCCKTAQSAMLMLLVAVLGKAFLGMLVVIYSAHLSCTLFNRKLAQAKQ